MSTVLIRIKRSEETDFYAESFRVAPRAVLTDEVDLDTTRNFVKQAEFFMVNDMDVKTALQEFARVNPGCEVQVFTLTQSGICPPGELVLKSVTKDGVLPV